MIFDKDRDAENAALLSIGPCTRCGYAVDSVTPAEGQERPHKDAVVICIGCGYVLVIDESPNLGLFVRPPTTEEAQGIYADPAVTRALTAVEAIGWRVRAAERRRREQRGDSP